MDNPQAYPCLDSSCGELSMRDPGMTLRDYFAGQALAGIVAAVMGTRDTNTTPDNFNAAIALGAYQLADAMLAERSKP